MQKGRVLSLSPSLYSLRLLDGCVNNYWRVNRGRVSFKETALIALRL